MRIRSHQGHTSTAIDMRGHMEKITSPIQLCHDTNKTIWDQHIQFDGINKGRRNLIHMSTNHPLTHALHRKCNVTIVLDSEKMFNDNMEIFASGNGQHYLTNGFEGRIPTEYFLEVHSYSENLVLRPPLL